MAKKNFNQSSKQGKARSGRRRDVGQDAVKIIALLVFILIGLGIVGGSIWYYSVFEPRAMAEIEDAAISFTKEYFDVQYNTITGEEGLAWASADLAEKISGNDRVVAWKDRQLVMRVKGDVEVVILDHGLRSAKARAIFWQYEEEKEEEGRDYLIFYDYNFVRQDGQWLVDKVITADPDELEDLRRRRGVWEEHYGDDEDDKGEEEEEETE